MNLAKYGRKIIITAAFAMLSSSLWAWNCIDAHPTINELAAEHFMARIQSGMYGEKYTNSHVDNRSRFDGLTFSKATLRERKSKIKNIKTNFAGWLARGGHDADVPTFAMGFRHFYDPIYEPHYLTWMRRWVKKPAKKDFPTEAIFFKSLDYRADDWNPNYEFGTKDRKIRLQPKILRPEIDAITWALKHEENEHNWQRGLAAYKAAMENRKSEFGELKRGQMFGKAFRCLGETMHLMADMAQPAHTRADSHSVYEPIEKSVNGEMIKRIIGTRHKNSEFKPVPEFKIVEGLTPEEQMKHLALFTNRHFFSNDTIFDYQKWVFPRNHKKAYSSPQLSNLKHVKGVYFAFFKTVGWIPMARETGSLFSKVFSGNEKYGRKNPKFNVLPDMAEHQAKVLIPLAVYNCANLIDNFLPTFKMELDIRNKDGNTFVANGELIHQVENDREWSDLGAIRYNGEGYLRINKRRLVRCEFREGKMTPREVTLDSGDQVELCLRTGGLLIMSPTIEP